MYEIGCVLNSTIYISGIVFFFLSQMHRHHPGRDAEPPPAGHDALRHGEDYISKNIYKTRKKMRLLQYSCSSPLIMTLMPFSLGLFWPLPAKNHHPFLPRPRINAQQEPPVSLEAEDIRNEKVKVVRSIVPVSVDDVVLGQYRGRVDGNGRRLPGYLEDPTVPAGSLTPTFAAAAFFSE
jgi:hypothetical protein